MICRCGHLKEGHTDSIPQCLNCYMDYGYGIVNEPIYNHKFKQDNLKYLEQLYESKLRTVKKETIAY